MTAGVLALRHADTLPYLAVRLRPAVSDRPATVDVYTGPADRPVLGVADPRELRAMAWHLLDAARWLDSQPGFSAVDEDDPQTTIFDLLEVPA